MAWIEDKSVWLLFNGLFASKNLTIALLFILDKFLEELRLWTV